MPRLLHHHHRLLARPNRRRLCRLLDGSVSAYGRKGSIDGRLLVPKKVVLFCFAWREHDGWMDGLLVVVNGTFVCMCV